MLFAVALGSAIQPADAQTAPPTAANSSAKFSTESRSGALGQDTNARIVAAFDNLPIALGGNFAGNPYLRRYIGGINFMPFGGTVVTLSGQRVEESGRQALQIDTPAWLSTNSLSIGLSQKLAFGPGEIRLVSNIDAWQSLKSPLIDNPILTANFLGAEGRRYAAGFDWAITPAFSARMTAGSEQGTRNGETGFFGSIDLRFNLEAWVLGISGWTSPNFGDGLQASLDYRFASGLTFGAFGGFEKSQQDKPFVGLRMSMPLGEPTNFADRAQLVANLDQQMNRMAYTMPGVPISAKKKAVEIKLKPRILVLRFETVYGVPCTAATTPVPGCTFDTQTGARITVDRDGDFNLHGNGSDDLWYVQFDGAGNGDVYDRLGVYQYSANVSSFAGYISGTTIGVGTTGFYWENIANGTYWLGQNGVLYSANVGDSRYGQAVN